MLKHLKRVFIQFAPGDARAASARELLQRVSSAKAKESNPACKVDFKVDVAGGPGGAFVDLTFADSEQRRIHTADFDVKDIAQQIEQKAAEMEMRSTMKEVGYDPWRPENRLSVAVGAVPRRRSKTGDPLVG